MRKMELTKAKKYLEDVLGHRRAIPFRRYSGNVGRTSQAKNEGAPAGQARWPAKSCEFLLNLLKNAESNAEVRTHTCSSAQAQYAIANMSRDDQPFQVVAAAQAMQLGRKRRAWDGVLGCCKAGDSNWAMDVRVAILQGSLHMAKGCAKKRVE